MHGLIFVGVYRWHIEWGSDQQLQRPFFRTSDYWEFIIYESQIWTLLWLWLLQLSVWQINWRLKNCFLCKMLSKSDKTILFCQSTNIFMFVKEKHLSISHWYDLFVFRNGRMTSLICHETYFLHPIFWFDMLIVSTVANYHFCFFLLLW